MRNVWTKLFFIVAISFVAMSFATWDTIYYSFQEQVEVYDTEEGYDYEGKGTGGNVTADMDITLGEAGSIVTTTTRRRGGTTKSTKYYYIIPVVLNSEPCFVCTEVSEAKKSNFDSLINGSIESIPLTGTFKKLDDQMYEYMVETIEDLNEYYDNAFFESDADLKAHVLPICLVPLAFENRNTFICILTGLFVLGVLFLYLGIRKSRKIHAAQAKIQAAQDTYEAELETIIKSNMNQVNNSPTNTLGNTTTENTSQNSQYQNTLDQFNDEHNH